jgi:hypothetical protein
MHIRSSSFPTPNPRKRFCRLRAPVALHRGQKCVPQHHRGDTPRASGDGDEQDQKLSKHFCV